MQSPVFYDEFNWLTMIFQKHRKSFHPIRHILSILFLETNLNNLFEDNKYEPFGSGPWLCLNKACLDHHKKVVTSLNITRCSDTKKPVGTFSCKCGFIYSRRGPDKNEKDQYYIGTIKEYGHVWMSKLRMLVLEGKSLTNIRKELEADPETIKKYASKMQLNVTWAPYKRKYEKKNNIIKNCNTLLIQRKKKWMEVQQQYPEKSKTEIREIIPNVFTYLYRHDREWLSEHSPNKKQVKMTYKRVDWNKRDEEIHELIKKTVQEWDRNDEKPIRITTFSIGRKINKLSLLQNNSDKLPATINFINEVVEDIETFQKRRIVFVIEKLLKEEEPFNESVVYRKAGIGSNASNEIRDFITTKVNEFEP